MRRSSAEATIVALLVARCVIEGVFFAAVAAGLQVGFAGDRPIPVVAVTLVLIGTGIVMASVLRAARAASQNMWLAIVVIAGAAGYGIATLPARPDGVTILGRLVFFGIAGEAFLWRNLGVARSLVRWIDARNAGFTAILALIAAALVPGAVDRAGLTVAAIVAIVATGLALSLARSAEELVLAGPDARGGAGRGTASGTSILLAALAIVAGALTPYGGDLLAQAADALLTLFGGLIYNVLLALGYVAAFFIAIVRAIASWFGPGIPRLPAIQPMSPFEEAEALRQLEATRPFVVGGIVIVIAVFAILIALVLVERMTRERRALLPEGASLERARVDGDGLGALLAGLLPRRARRPAAPRDDGTPAGALRHLYWRLLRYSDAAGIGWRGIGETPAEHLQRALAREPRFAAAGALVRAFEDLRYGERPPAGATLARARAALAELDRQR
ncbi:MAG TPA: DUF4129 domain-containing protein [Candidatus Limnocylindria bacterium]|nr:DUF4129 domain-containing protein [Candidatus Limnocylindria bacterium]